MTNCGAGYYQGSLLVTRMASSQKACHALGSFESLRQSHGKKVNPDLRAICWLHDAMLRGLATWEDGVPESECSGLQHEGQWHGLENGGPPRRNIQAFRVPSVCRAIQWVAMLCHAHRTSSASQSRNASSAASK